MSSPNDPNAHTPTRWRTLDKDLGRIGLLERATTFVARPLIAPGIAIAFVVLVAAASLAFIGVQPGTFVVVAATVIGAYMALNIGANDVANNMGPAVGANALTLGSALIIAAIFETAGALIAGGDVVNTIASGIIAPDAVSDGRTFVLAMLAALLAAALWLNLATVIGAPVSTTHSIVGGVVGAGIVAAGMASVKWQVLGKIAASWVISPLLGGLIAAVFLAFIKARILYRQDKIAAARRWVPVLIGLMAGAFGAYLALKGLSKVVKIGLQMSLLIAAVFLAFIKARILYRQDKIAAARRWVPVLIGLMAGAFGAYLALKGLSKVVKMSLQASLLIGLVAGLLVWLLSVPMVKRQSQGLENRKKSIRKLFGIPLVCSAALLSFAHGANDVANAVGPLAAIVHAVQAGNVQGQVGIPLWVMAIGALGISFGLLLFGPRLIRLVGSQITKLNPMRAYCVSLSAAVTVILASWLGLPVSSTHIAVGAIFGVGFFREWHAERRARQLGIRKGKPLAPEERARRKLVRRSHFVTVAAAWVITVPVSALLSGALFWVLSHTMP